MKLKPLSAALLAVGALTVVSAGAIDMPAWLKWAGRSLTGGGRPG